MLEFLTALERTAWQMREKAEEAAISLKEAERWSQVAARVSSTGWMLTRVAADYRLFAIYSAFLTRKRIADQRQRLHARSARRFYDTSIRHQGAFLKLGQMLSARPDLLPEVWVQTLSGLQDAAPAEPFDIVRELIEADLGASLGERFASFDETPLAAASIGQVHRAVTHDGVEVAVKVQRPNIREQIEIDLGLLEVFLTSLVDVLPPTDYPTIVAEVREMLGRELDYAGEAAAMAEMARFFDGQSGVRVPTPRLDLCGPRVLTSTYIAGEKISVALDRMDQPARSAILGRLLQVYLRQVLEAGQFQADPHPGNFLVTAEGELVLLDFGCMRALAQETRRDYLALVQAFLIGDRERLGALLSGLGFQTASGTSDTLEAFAALILDRFREAAAAGRFEWPTRDQLLAESAGLLEAARRDPVIRIPAEFVMLGRVFGTLSGLFLHYRPSIDYATRVLPHLMRAI